VSDADDPATARDRLADTTARLGVGGGGRLAELLGPLAGLPGRPVGPGEIQAGWRQVLLGLAQDEPTVLVVEDLHFADPALLHFLTDLVGAAGELPLLVLCTHRPELFDDQPSWTASLPGTLSVSLGSLRGPRLRSLISSLLFRHALPDNLADRLATITNGNPMYAVEYVNMLAERTAGEDTDADADLAIPETVHGVVANRIDLLERMERQVLHAAAVLGEPVWPAAIASMMELRVEDVVPALRNLQRRDLLVAGAVSSGSASGDAELSFRHILVRDVAYGRLSRSARARLHRRAADWIDRMAVAGRHDMTPAIARHRTAALRLAESLGEDDAADAAAARDALIAAAEASFATYAVKPALNYLDQALSLWPADLDVDRLHGFELLRWRLTFLADSDRFYRDGGAKEVARLVERMREADDRGGQARAETLLGQVEVMRAERHRALEHLRRATALFADLPDDAAKAEAYAELARLHMVQFETAQAIVAAEQARVLAERLGLADATANAVVTRCMAGYIAGDSDAIGELERCLEHCRELRLPALRRAAANLAVIMQEEGELAAAAHLERESVAARGAQVSLVLSHSEEAELAWFTGDWLTLMDAAADYLDGEDAETTEWDLQLRGRRACLRRLYEEDPGEDLARCLDTARRSGFARLIFNACAYGAFGHALAGEPEPAAALLRELAEAWARTPTALTVEWLSALAHTSALAASPVVTQLVTQVLASAPIRNRWVVAAEAVVAGDYADAVARYDDIGSASDAILAAVWAARACRAAGQVGPAEQLVARVRAFAERNRVPGLAALVG
jgi:hypothetical protein